MLNGVAHCQMLFDGDRPDDFVYLAVNPAFEALTGLRNVVGRAVTDVIPGIRETAPELFEIYGRVVRTGQPERFQYWLGPLGLWLDISVHRTRQDRFVAVFDDITERKVMERALRATEADYRTLIESAADGIFTLDAAGRISSVNAMACQMLGCTHEEALALSVNDVVSPGDLARVGPALAHIASGQVVRSEW